MSNELVTASDLSQALSRSLLDVTMGRETKKSKLQNQIDISDALNRRMQTQINTMKVMIEAKKSGIDFAAAMRDIRAVMRESGEDIESAVVAFNNEEDELCFSPKDATGLVAAHARYTGATGQKGIELAHQSSPDRVAP